MTTTSARMKAPTVLTPKIDQGKAPDGVGQINVAAYRAYPPMQPPRNMATTTSMRNVGQDERRDCSNADGVAPCRVDSASECVTGTSLRRRAVETVGRDAATDDGGPHRRDVFLPYNRSATPTWRAPIRSAASEIVRPRR